MNLQSITTRCLMACTTLALVPFAQAEVITTFANGSDWTMQRNDTTASGSDDGRLLVKNNNFNDDLDRIGVAEFDSSGLSPVTVASVRFQMARDTTTNGFRAGETIQLWGVPDGDANESFDQSVAFPDNPFVGDDATDNLVIDDDLVFLGSITFAEGTGGTGVREYLDFFGPSVTSFVQNDTNGVLKFLLTAVAETHVDSTPFLTHEEGLFDGDTYPSVLTNEDAVIPEPGSLALLGLGGLLAFRRRG